MSNNLTQTKGEGINREEQQIQTINIDNRKDRRTSNNNNTFNPSEINHTSFLIIHLLSCCCTRVILFCRCPCLWYCSSSSSPAPLSSFSYSVCLLYCNVTVRTNRYYYLSRTPILVFPNESKSETVGARRICTVPTSLGVKLVKYNETLS